MMNLLAILCTPQIIRDIVADQSVNGQGHQDPGSVDEGQGLPDGQDKVLSNESVSDGENLIKIEKIGTSSHVASVDNPTDNSSIIVRHQCRHTSGEEDQALAIDKSSENSSKKHIATENSVNKPETTENSANKLETTENSVNKPGTTENSAKKPETTENNANKAETTENSANKLETIEDINNKVEFANNSSINPHSTENNTNKIQTIEYSINEPNTIEGSTNKADLTETSTDNTCDTYADKPEKDKVPGDTAADNDSKGQVGPKLEEEKDEDAFVEENYQTNGEVKICEENPSVLHSELCSLDLVTNSSEPIVLGRWPDFSPVVTPGLLTEPFGDNNTTLLHVAAREGHGAVVAMLMDFGASPAVRYKV